MGPVTRLERPDVRWHASWAEAMQEFETDFPHGSALTDPPPTYDVDGCAAWVARLRAAEFTPPRPDWVTCTYYWILDGAAGAEDPAQPQPTEEVVGFLALRHDLNDFLLQEGGHIGYSVRPSRQRQGHATRALALALDEARGLGLERVLVTCDEGNLPSRRTIEAGGGVYEDSREGKRRYWIELAA